MYRSALRAKLYLLRRNYHALLWGFVIVPATYLLFVGALALIAGEKARALDPLLLAARASALGGNPVVHLFVAVGAAAIFGENYRYATWRLVSPRARRFDLLFADGTAFFFASLLMLAMTMAGCVALSYLNGAVSGARYVEGAGWIDLALLILISAGELLATGVVVAVTVIATRSPMASVFTAFFLSAGQAMAQSFASGGQAGIWLALPTFAGDTLRNWVLEPKGIPDVGGSTAMLAFAGLAVWVAAGTCLALILLQRQDWTRE